MKRKQENINREMKEEYAYKKQKHELGQSSENVLIKANNPGGALLK